MLDKVETLLWLKLEHPFTVVVRLPVAVELAAVTFDELQWPSLSLILSEMQSSYQRGRSIEETYPSSRTVVKIKRDKFDIEVSGR